MNMSNVAFACNTTAYQGVLPEHIRREERGWAGHYICAKDCLFRRNTLLSFMGDSIVVSTVGDKVLLMNGNLVQQEISPGRYYETIAFFSKEQHGYYDADVRHTIKFSSDWCINEINIHTDRRANDMHEMAVDCIMRGWNTHLDELVWKTWCEFSGNADHSKYITWLNTGIPKWNGLNPLSQIGFGDYRSVIELLDNWLEEKRVY